MSTGQSPRRNADGNAVIDGPLYHYTSVEALKGIVDNGVFEATHAFYMSDATEISYGIGRIRKVCARRATLDQAKDEILRQLGDWLQDLLVSPPQIFVMCCSAKDDDLNQWRSYSPRSGGVCIVFDTPSLLTRAGVQGWQWSNCKYDKGDQAEWIDREINRLLTRALERGPQPAHPSQTYHKVFQDEVEGLLQVACRLKDHKFAEEHEWRLISPYIEHFADKRIGYRAQGSMLIPFARFELGDILSSGIISEVVVGPTAHRHLSFNSISTYLSPRMKPSRVRASTVPYRVF